MKKKLSREVKIGIFGLIIMIGMYLGFNFIKSKHLFSRDNAFYAIYNQADGIEVSSPVLIKGFRVGTVEKVSFDVKTTNVVVKVSVKDDYPIPVDSKAKIASTSLLGGKALEIQLGDSAKYHESGDTIKTAIDQNLLQLAGDEYERLKSMASTLIEQVSVALAGVNEVLSKENVANLSSTLSNLKDMSGSLNSMVDGPNSNVGVVIANLSSISSSLKRSTPYLENGIAKFSLLADSLSVSVPSLTSNATSAIDKLNATLAKMESGQGTLGKIVNDEELYTNLTQATESLNLLLMDIKQNPKRYINVSIFGKKDK